MKLPLIGRLSLPDLRKGVTVLNLGLAVLGWTLGTIPLFKGTVTLETVAWTGVGVATTLFLLGITMFKRRR